MGLRLKEGFGSDELRKYGFELGSVLGEKDSFNRCLEGIGYAYMDSWAHKFLMDPDEPEKIYRRGVRYSYGAHLFQA